MPETDYECIIAFDVAKDHLDYCLIPGETTGRLANSRRAVQAFLRRHRARTGAHPLVICEATGGCERLLIETALALGLPVHRAEGRRIRLFAQAQGMRAKTDRIDALMIADYARKARNLRLYEAPSPERQALAGLVRRREQLLEMRLREENRLAGQAEPWVKTSVRQVIACLKRQIKAAEAEIAALIKRSETLNRQSRLLRSLAGVGAVTAMTLMADMPEIGSLSKAQAAALAGLAPYSRDSGKTCQRRRLAGGRFRLRRCLFMAATVAIRRNPILKRQFESLTANAKPYKVALVAVMRKMIVILNAIIKSDQPWHAAKSP